MLILLAHIINVYLTIVVIYKRRSNVYFHNLFAF
jgi:hypothetical protein